MKISLFSAAFIVAMAAAVTAHADSAILQFDTMAGVSGPFLGPNNAIRGVPGGGAPWRLDAAKGELKIDGRLEIEVRGLVLVTTGANPAPAFRGVVSCQIIDQAGAPGIVNVSTGDFPATPTGASRIEAQVQLPSRCFAPIVFVTNSAGRWFSVTGF